MRFRENVSLAQYSYYKIGGDARFFFEAKNEKELAWAVREAKAQKLPIFVLAGGTNILIADEGFDGLVLRPALTALSIKEPRRAAAANAVKKQTPHKARTITVTAGAGATMDDLVRLTARRGLEGFAWAGGLPGTVGGAVRGNAGCFGSEMKDVVTTVRSFDLRTMAFVTRTAAECKFGYRASIFKKKETRKGGGEIVVSVTFRLKEGDTHAIKKAVREKIVYRERAHPLEHPNIGSTFKNVPLRSVHPRASAEYRAACNAGELMFCGSQFSVKTDPVPVISAAKLISETGIRGVSVGGAMISPKHPNFIVNTWGANAQEVKALMALAKAEVHRKFGVALEEEVQVMDPKTSRIMRNA